MKRVLAIDVGGTNIKMLATGQPERLRFPSGPKMTPQRMVTAIKKMAADWDYDVIAIGYPGRVIANKPFAEPHNLGRGWTRFNFRTAFKRPVKIINDAAMQALGSYRKGNLLFLGLGTGLGTAMIVGGTIVPMELAHLPYKNATFEDYLGLRGLERWGRKKWQSHVESCVAHLIAAFEPDDVVIGGGNAKKLLKLPEGCREGANTNAFLGGFRLWERQEAAGSRE